MVKHSIVAVSTYGCIRSGAQKKLFKDGLSAMLRTLEPTDVLVHGHMPESVFGEFLSSCQFHRYPSLFEEKHGTDKGAA